MKLLGEFIVHEVLRLNIQEEGSSFHFIQNFGLKKVFHFALQKKFSKEEKTKQTNKKATLCMLTYFTNTKGCSPPAQGQHLVAEEKSH